MSVEVTRAEIAATAIADCFSGDGEIIANPIGTTPVAGGRLAKATSDIALVMTDGEALLVENIVPLGADAPEKVVSGWNPYRRMLEISWSGRRHVMMGAVQLDRFGNQNIAFIGDPAKPSVQLLGLRGAPGNTICNRTSYWVPAHSPRVFVEEVSVVSGVGTDRAAALGASGRFHDLGWVVTNLAVLDFEGPDATMRIRSVHPGVSVDEVREATGFELALAAEHPDDVPESRLPTDEELELLREVIDPDGMCNREVGE